MKQAHYWLLAALGGDSWFPFGYLYYLASREKWMVTGTEFEKYVRRSREYGWIKQNYPSYNIRDPRIKFAITERGGKALEAFKKERYFGTKEAYRLEDGKLEREIFVPLGRKAPWHSRAQRYTNYRGRI